MKIKFVIKYEIVFHYTTYFIIAMLKKFALTVYDAKYSIALCLLICPADSSKNNLTNLVPNFDPKDGILDAK